MTVHQELARRARRRAWLEALVAAYAAVAVVASAVLAGLGAGTTATAIGGLTPLALAFIVLGVARFSVCDRLPCPWCGVDLSWLLRSAPCRVKVRRVRHCHECGARLDEEPAGTSTALVNFTKSAWRDPLA